MYSRNHFRIVARIPLQQSLELLDVEEQHMFCFPFFCEILFHGVLLEVIEAYLSRTLIVDLLDAGLNVLSLL